MKKYYVYALTRNDSVFYVGVTIDMDRRLYQHRRSYGKQVSMQLLEEFYGEEDGALILERSWIKRYKDFGISLVNIANYEATKKLRTYKISDEHYFRAMEKAAMDGVTLSELISGFIEAYGAGKRSFVLFKKSGIKEFFINE